MNGRLETLSNVVTIVAAVALTALTVSRLLAPGAMPATAPTPSAGLYEAGDHMDILEGVHYASVERTLIMHVSQSCQYCTASMGFYRRLVETRNARQWRVQFVASSREHAAGVDAYLRKHGVTLDRVATVTAETATLFLAPTPCSFSWTGTDRCRRCGTGSWTPEARRS